MTSRCDLPGAKNLQMAVGGSVLFLYCDLSKDCGASSSGKTVLISSSSGNKPLGKSGAFLGLNIFTKSLEKRDLSAKGVEELKSATFTAVGDGCQWRIEEDGHTLCFRIDFAAVKPRPGASGKSTLLATTSGNKSVASTGLSCGLNCYYPAAATFDASQLEAGVSPQEALQVGASADAGNGFTVTYTSVNSMCVRYVYAAADMADGHTASMPTFRLGDLSVTLFVSAVKAARARKESKGTKVDSPQPSQNQEDEDASGGGTTGTHGHLLLAAGKEEKVRNVTATCTADADGDAHDLTFIFDPTATYGRSTSGKSMTVATTGGFQRLGNADGREVCRVSLNAYRPAPPVTDSEIAAAVTSVLASKPAASLATLSFKDVLTEVLAEMGAGEGMKDALRDKIKEKVGSFLNSQV